MSSAHRPLVYDPAHSSHTASALKQLRHQIRSTLVIRHVVPQAHHLLDGRLVLLALLQPVPRPVDQLVDHVVQPQHVRVRLKRRPHVAQPLSHQPVDLVLVVARRREQVLVMPQVVKLQVVPLVQHPRQRVVDDGHLDALGRHRDPLSIQHERRLTLLRVPQQNVAPVQVAMLKLVLGLGYGQCQHRLRNKITSKGGSPWKGKHKSRALVSLHNLTVQMQDKKAEALRDNGMKNKQHRRTKDLAER